ncbi:MAG: hypothetical protein Q8N23_29375 [Archangium sp.]|nr:hypothetical protein [Archangium sp.]MDP3156817.1 hypothetical protein [Archangium sp.]MDP3569665.1 hypothetical protein [Archangium sp.]
MNLKRIGLLTMMVFSSSCAVVQKIDSVIDCAGICDRYASCFDSAYDKSACASRCRQAASDQPDYRRKADMCNACISERSCVAASFACATECVSVVP